MECFLKILNSLNLIIRTTQLIFKRPDLKLKFHLRCLWQKQFCINELKAEKLTIQTKTSNKASEEKAPFEMPLGIKADRVFIKNTQVILSNQTIEVIDLASAVNITGNTFTFNSPSARYHNNYFN